MEHKVYTAIYLLGGIVAMKRYLTWRLPKTVKLTTFSVIIWALAGCIVNLH